MKKFLVFFVIISFFFNSRSASSHLAQFEEKTLSMLRSLTQPEASSDLPFSPSNAAYSADGQLLEIDPATTILAQETYWTSDGTLIPITALRREYGITLINHKNNQRAESTATHLNWPIDPSQFSNPFHPASVSLHPHQLRVALTNDQGNLVFINFTRNNFSVTEKAHSHTTACHEGVGPQILFGPKDLFASELHGQVCIYNEDNPEGKIITHAFSPFDWPLAVSSEESLVLDHQLHENNKNTCVIKFNPDPRNEQLVVHYNNNLYIFDGRTGEIQTRISDTQPISSFTRRGEEFVYLQNNNELITLNTQNLEPHRLIRGHTNIIEQITCCPFSNPLLLILSGNSDKKTIAVYDIYKGKILESSDPNFKKVQWVPNTKTISACTNPENNVPQIKQWDLDQTSATYQYAQEDHGAFNINKINFFDSLIWQINNGEILELQDGQDLSETFSQFPSEVQLELLATGKIIFSEPNLLPEDQDEPNYGDTPPPAYDDIFLDTVGGESSLTTTNPEVENPQQRPSRFQRFLALIGFRRLQDND
jgi:hypothetical protein